MNVTIKIDDQLCREARHRAVDRGLSLSAWVAELLRRELESPKREKEGLLESLAMEQGEELEFEVPRDDSGSRGLTFP